MILIGSFQHCFIGVRMHCQGEMWIYVHSMATMLATSYLELDEDFISRVITNGYEGLKIRYMGRKSI